MIRCKYTKANDKQCNRNISAKLGKFCWQHQKEDPKVNNKMSNILSSLTKEDRDFIGCALDSVGIYVPIKIIGEGASGRVYKACKINDCNYVVKFMRDPPFSKKVVPTKSQMRCSTKEDCPTAHLCIDALCQHEGKYAKIAGDIEIGPKVYDYGYCIDSRGPVYYIIMEYVGGVTLLDKFPWKSKYLTKALDAYYELAEKTGILQNDLNVENVIITPQNGIKIIDYGIATLLPSDVDDKHKLIMESIKRTIEWFILTFTAEYMFDEEKYPWVNMNRSERRQHLMDIYDTINLWFKNKKYPLKESDLIKKTYHMRVFLK